MSTGKDVDNFIESLNSSTKPEQKEPVAKKDTPTPPPAPKEESKAQPFVVKTELDSYIHDRLKTQPSSLDDIQVKAVSDAEEYSRILSLPKYFEKYKDKYSFRWLNKNKKALDRAIDVIGWYVVKHILFPELPDHLVTANGTVERGDAILAFLPKEQAEQIRLAPAKLSRERVAATPVQNLRKWKDTGSEHHYKPDLGAAENDDENAPGLVVKPDEDQE